MTKLNPTKMQFATLLMLFLTCLFARPGACHFEEYDPNTMQFPVTPSQAATNIRQWCGNPNLELAQKKVWIADYTDDQTFYCYTTSNNSQEFAVNCQNGYVIRWRNHAVGDAAESKFRSLNIMDKLPLTELRESCENFIAARFPDFANKNMQPECEAMPKVSLYARFSNGVWDWGNFVTCRADEWTGEIYYYDAKISSPPSRSLTYSVTQQTAEQVATACFQAWLPNPSQESFLIEYNHGVWLLRDNNGNEPLVWRIDFAMAEEPGLTVADFIESADSKPYNVYEIQVDANTGQVVSGPMDSNRYEGHEIYPPFVATP